MYIHFGFIEAKYTSILSLINQIVDSKVVCVGYETVFDWCSIALKDLFKNINIEKAMKIETKSAVGCA